MKTLLALLPYAIVIGEKVNKTVPGSRILSQLQDPEREQEFDAVVESLKTICKEAIERIAAEARLGIPAALEQKKAGENPEMHLGPENLILTEEEYTRYMTLVEGYVNANRGDLNDEEFLVELVLVGDKMLAFGLEMILGEVQDRISTEWRDALIEAGLLKPQPEAGIGGFLAKLFGLAADGQESDNPRIGVAIVKTVPGEQQATSEAEGDTIRDSVSGSTAGNGSSEADIPGAN